MFERFESASGFIFDCDGCLLDSMPAWRKIENSLIDMSGVPFTQAMLEAMRAAPLPEVARVFHEKYGVMESAQAITDYIDEAMWAYYRTSATAKPGAREFVTRLREAGVPCCIVSATPKGMLEAGMDTCGMRDLFCEIISTKEADISKQDPRIFEMALERMGARPQTAWGADDSLYAIRVMNGCGISTIGTYDNDNAGTMEQFGREATLAVRSLAELLV